MKKGGIDLDIKMTTKKMGFKSPFERCYGLLMADFVWVGVPLIRAAKRERALTNIIMSVNTMMIIL